MCLQQEELGNASLPVNTVIESLRYGGVVSTGSHGTARDFGPMSDFIESMTIVDGRGQPVVYDASHPHFNQARFSVLIVACLHGTEQEPACEQGMASPCKQGVRASRDVTGSCKELLLTTPSRNARHSFVATTIKG